MRDRKISFPTELQKLASQADAIMEQIEKQRLMDNWKGRVIEEIEIVENNIFIFFSENRWACLRVTSENNRISVQLHNRINVLDQLERFINRQIITPVQAEILVDYFEGKKIEQERQKELFSLRDRIRRFNSKYKGNLDTDFILGNTEGKEKENAKSDT